MDEPALSERLRSLVGRESERLGKRGWHALRLLRSAWHRSLHFRVVTITTLLGLIFTLALGTYMYQRIADGLVQSKLAEAEQQSLLLRTPIQTSFTGSDRTDPAGLKNLMAQIVQTPTGSTQPVLIIIRQSLGNTAAPLPKVSSPGISPDIVPADVERAIQRDPAHQQTKIVDVQGIPAIMVGSAITIPYNGSYNLVFVYTMETEVQTLDIVRGSFLAGGAAIVLLLAGLAYMVTRMVVTPVRSAAHVSERLSAGALNERMEVHGDDDLARLATSFNAMADSMQRQIRQLEDLSSLQQRFTSDVSHELRTPLTTIRMAADMLHASREDFAAPVSRSAELLSRELDRFEALLTDLLEISRHDAGAATVQWEPTDIRDIVTRVVDAAAPLAVRSGSSIRVHARRPAIATMDARRVERIVRNLVTNSIEHGEGKPIDISVGANATAIAVSVRDYGVGLRPGDAAMVFNRFWRADPARARTTGGTGLGLSISLEDARLHGGWLQAWGEPGHGACFRLTLPVGQGAPIERSPLSLAPDDSQVGLEMPAGNSLTIGSQAASMTPPERPDGIPR